ncbi:hypothetical protein [Streptomyces sp. 840.1]|uniref:hypothetical protein n=1 Tax=Streptomyces sp. 840.1 TaxID=2485152 RepID=UPI000F48C5BF|nr:hypothetical protein [Streptomyces sp. 840.1]
MSDHQTNGPFRSPVSIERQNVWVEAALATPHVKSPRSALQNAAAFLVDPEHTLSEPDVNGVRTIREGALRTVRTDAGEMLVVEVQMHGVAGIVWEHNERISSLWHSTADPSVGRGTKRSLTRVHPWPHESPDEDNQPYAALLSHPPNRQWLTSNTEEASDELDRRDGLRSYDLKEDLVLNGQQEPGMYIPQRFCLAEQPPVGADGVAEHPAEYVGWMAVRGNNRTKRRQDIFGLTSAEVLTGVPASKLGLPGDEVFFDPQFWLEKLSYRLNQEWADAQISGDDEATAIRATNVAVVTAHLVVGTPTPERLYRIVQMSNRRDHVHPPLEFVPNDRGRALGRSVLGMYVAQGVLDERESQVLSGLAPVNELSTAAEDATVSELRDLRSMMILRELFPVDPYKKLLIRRALSESPPSQLSSPEINRRARAWSALTSESYPAPWNPRIAEVFNAGSVRAGLHFSERPLRELLNVADKDDDAFEELVAYRAAHWLAAFDIIDADRGSLAGQKTDDDDGAKAARVRRTVKNHLNALRSNRIMAVAVLRELAKAMDEGDRRPIRVSRSGALLIEEMTTAWFDREFPKDSGKRRPKVPAPRPGPSSAATVQNGSAGTAPATALFPLHTWRHQPGSVATGPFPLLPAPAGAGTAPALGGPGGVGPTVSGETEPGEPSFEERVEAAVTLTRRLLELAEQAEASLTAVSAAAAKAGIARPLAGRDGADAALHLARTLPSVRTMRDTVEDLGGRTERYGA